MALWTPENANTAADFIAAKYAGGLTSQVLALSGLRKSLLALGVDRAILDWTRRAELTTEFNARNEARRNERIAEGINVPVPYLSIDGLKGRAQAFIDAKDAEVSGQNAADFMVIFSARPGEVNTLDLGPSGGVTGVLKKRGPDNYRVYPIVSSVGMELAEGYIKAWKARPLRARTVAIANARALVAEWIPGGQLRDLRAIGAALAVRAQVAAGEVPNVGLQREVHRQALRHEPVRAGAQANYDRVNDPVDQLCEQMRQLSAGDREDLSQLIAMRLAAPRT